MKSWQLTFGLGAIFAIGILIVALVRLQLPDTTTSTATLDIEIAKAALTSCVVAHRHDAIGEFHDAEVVGDHDGGDPAIVCQIAQQRHHVECSAVVEC